MAGPAAVWIARRLPVDDAAHREEVAGSVAELVAERPRGERAREAVSLIGLWLQLWGRREGLDDVRQAARQGIYLGGVLLTFAAAAEAWSARGWGSAIAAVLASVAAALAAGGWRGGAAGAAAGSAIAASLAAATLPALPVLAVVALVVGARFGARRCWRGLTAGTLIAVLVGLVAVSVEAVAAGGAAVALGATASALLVVGRFDARFAVAATTAGLGVLVTVSTPAPVVTAVVLLVVLSGQLSWSALRRSFSV